ncbi:actin organization and endocytosis protein, partial [Coemansia sp. RSA 2607]
MNGQAGVPALSFVPADEAAGYVRLFQSSGGSSAAGGRIGGDAARTVLMQSRLPVSDLGRIWELADTRKMGSLSQMPVPMQTPAQHVPTSMHMPTPVQAPATSRTQDPAAPESLADFEASFPSLSPAGASAAAPTNALSSVRQSFAQGGAARTWAITPAERSSYAAVFRQWAGGRRVLGGAQAREVFAQSGLTQAELARVWALADASNQGELNGDEFAVAMHVIFRRLAGEPIPAQLPPDLVPHSTRDFVDSLAAMKQQLMSDAPRRKTPAPAATTTASEYSDDDDTTYTSANRRRPGTTTPAPAAASASSPAPAQSVEQLRRTVAQRRNDVERARAAASARQTAGAESRVTRRWRIDDLKKEIEDIHRTTPAPDDVTSERGRLLAKRRALAASVQDALRQLPEAVAEYSRLARELAAVRRDVAGRRRTASGAQNNADDMQARAARLVAQRMAALTGEAPEEEEQDDEEEKEIARELAQRNDRAETVSSSVRRVQQAVRGLPGATMLVPWADEQAASEEVRELLGRLRRIERQPSKQRASAFSPVADAPAKDESRGAA